MKRFVLVTGLIVAIAVAAFAPLGTASANVTSLQLEPRADLADTHTAAVSTGTIVCTAGDTVTVFVTIIQSSGKTDALATGLTTVICSGQVQSFSVVSNVFFGTALKKGPAVAAFGASDTTDGTAFPTQTQGMKLH